jgi:uncharacterized protein with HEPN domain
MSRDVLILLSEIQEAAEEVIAFTHGLSVDELKVDKKTKNAVIRSLEVMGEAAKAIPQSFRDEHPTVPWRNICGMRDILIHQYFRIDEMLLWRAARRDVPATLEAICDLIKNFR